MNSLTDPKSIIESVNKEIIIFKESFLTMNNTSIDFVNLYNDTKRNKVYDASILKERMKTAVIKAVSDDKL